MLPEDKAAMLEMEYHSPREYNTVSSRRSQELVFRSALHGSMQRQVGTDAKEGAAKKCVAGESTASIIMNAVDVGVRMDQIAVERNRGTSMSAKDVQDAHVESVRKASKHAGGR